MRNNIYKPEGGIITTYINRDYIFSTDGLKRAMENDAILEAVASMCDDELSLHFNLGSVHGIMKKEECLYCRDNEEIKDIAVLTRVGKPVCFKVKNIVEDALTGGVIAILSRKDAQRECYEQYISKLKCGDIIPAKVTHLESFGAFLDIGCGIASLLSVDSISVSRISHPKERLYCGAYINVVIKNIDSDTGRIFASQRELLGTWEENAQEFCAGQTVTGIVRSIENYGVFIELAPNLAGLAEIGDVDIDSDNARALIGRSVSVYIKSIIPERMKIKLVIIDWYSGDDLVKSRQKPKINYYVDCENTKHISYWKYSPDSSYKIIESCFE